MQVRNDIKALDLLLEHAASAACLVGHVDADEPIVRQFVDHVDAIVHKLTELHARHSAVHATMSLALVPIAGASNPGNVA